MNIPNPIHVVLVRPHYSRNVGSVSRAMANMGAQKLILIQPECEINLEARQGAAGAQTHLLEHTSYSSWKDFFDNEPEGLRIAFSAQHKKETDTLSLEDRVKHLRSEGFLPRLPLYLFFGPEDHGLSNEDVAFANFICRLPIYGPFTSLNLSHAVLLALYICRTWLHSAPTVSAEPPSETFHFPESAIQGWLQTLGFEIGDRRTDVYKVLKRILLRNLASDKELRILEAIVNQTLRKLPKKTDL